MKTIAIVMDVIISICIKLSKNLKNGVAKLGPRCKMLTAGIKTISLLNKNIHTINSIDVHKFKEPKKLSKNVVLIL